MILKKMNLLISLIALIGLIAINNKAVAALATTSAELTDSTSQSTYGTTASTKKLFSQTEKERLEQFVDQNFDRLQEQAARGSGVLLNDYVSLLGCQNNNNVMGKAIQQNYSQLFTAGKSQLIPQTRKALNQKSSLALVCENQT